MNKLPKGLKAIMFDLGGVIIELDYERTAKELAGLAGIEMEQLGDLLVTAEVLQRFEVGAVSEVQFRRDVCEILNIRLTAYEFDRIWCALLGEISAERLSSLSQVSFQTLILSNTNSIHERAFNDILKRDHGLNSLASLVDKVYFSHKMKKRKPNADSYLLVLEEQKLRPHEVLFIDDREDNIEAAAQVGLHVFHNRNIDDWMRLF